MPQHVFLDITSTVVTALVAQGYTIPPHGTVLVDPQGNARPINVNAPPPINGSIGVALTDAVMTSGQIFQVQITGTIRVSQQKGDLGPQGIQGLQGTNPGVQGPQGGQGLQGTNPGVQGPQGNTGAQGNQGLQGLQGLQGRQGYQGDTGSQGLQGTNPGVQGPQGEYGTQGYQGVDGFQGVQGDTGTQGSVGAQGFQGPPNWGVVGTSPLGGGVADTLITISIGGVGYQLLAIAVP